jgi:hypothetical protein
VLTVLPYTLFFMEATSKSLSDPRSGDRGGQDEVNVRGEVAGTRDQISSAGNLQGSVRLSPMIPTHTFMDNQF